MILALAGGVALASAVAMLVLREPMRVALALITTMAALGAVYGLLGVHFIAAFQVLIYVGAVMVFMVYVIMLLQVRESGDRPRLSSVGVPGAIGGVLLLAALAAGIARSDALSPTASASPATPFGLVAFSQAFLREYWLEFELTTVLLVAAVAAALAVVGVSRRAQAQHGGARHGMSSQEAR